MAHIQGMNDKAKGKITRKMNDKAKGKITRLPDSLNPNKLIMEAMDKKYSVCPFCGESRRVGPISSKYGVRKNRTKRWYGKKKESFFSDFKFWEKDHCWNVDQWECKSCGAAWESDPYPTDIMSGDDLSKIYTFEIGELGIVSGSDDKF